VYPPPKKYNIARLSKKIAIIPLSFIKKVWYNVYIDKFNLIRGEKNERGT